MKLSDFTMIESNIAEDGEPERKGLWKTGSRKNMIGIGMYNGEKYQVKIHADEPKWFLADEKIRAAEAALAACKADPYDDTYQRLQSELNSLKSGKAKNDKKDKISDGYLECKQRLIQAIKSANDPCIVGPADFWKEPLSFRGNGVYASEAAPWVEPIMSFTPGKKPLLFQNQTDEVKYRIVASLADAVAKLHACGVIHGDLKLGNTLIVNMGGEFKVVLIDFDAALLMEDVHNRRYAFDVWQYVVGGTYFSPEGKRFFDITRDEPDEDAYDAFDVASLTGKSDIFALAITIYEYFYGRADLSEPIPFVSPDGKEEVKVTVYEALARAGYKPVFPEDMPEFMSSTLRWMLEADPNDRPTAEQVRDIFLAADDSIVPAKYKPDPNSVLWPDHYGKYSLTEEDGKTLLRPDARIERATGQLYRVIRGVTRFTRRIDELLQDGYVRSLEEKKTDGGENKLWPADGDGVLPDCVERSAIVGKYRVSNGVVLKTLTFAELKRDGYICDEAEKSKPWPIDTDITFVTAGIMRDMGRNRGPGHYVIGTGSLARRFKKQDLIAAGHAKSTAGSVKPFVLWPQDAAYEPNLEGIPENVKEIMKNVLIIHKYRVNYKDGSSEMLMIDEMFARGYVKKK